MEKSAFPGTYWQGVQGAKNSQTPTVDLSAMYLTLFLDVKTKLFASIYQSPKIKGKHLNDGAQDQTFAQKVNGYLGLDYILHRKI